MAFSFFSSSVTACYSKHLLWILLASLETTVQLLGAIVIKPLCIM